MDDFFDFEDVFFEIRVEFVEVESVAIVAPEGCPRFAEDGCELRWGEGVVLG